MEIPRTGHASSSAVMFAFACVYICWGATYTAARLGVHFVPAPALAGVRLLIGGSLMLGFMALRGKRLLGSMREMRRLFILGVLMLFFGNVGLVWAEFYLPSGLAALLVAIIPVYIAVIEWLMPHGERLRTRGEIGLVLGFIGLVVLAFPSARNGFHGDWHQLVAIVVLLLGALSFSFGSVWSRGTRFSLDPFVCAAWEMLAACVCDLVVATVRHQWGRATWNNESVSAIAFLILFGSLTGFSAYTWLLQNVPVSKVATYAYVNPMVAVLLGAIVLGERLHGNEWIGMVMILVAVFLVTSSKMQPDHEVSEIESMATEG
ncbi:MAG TPA: EamA family transporter [Acidobacteriaceae bacterium]|nr:EamA family transporter [Acidobacteriaceae bacterium]